MFGTILGLFFLLILAVILGALTRRAWKAKRAWVKWSGTVLAGLFTLVFALLTIIGALGTYKLFRVYNPAFFSLLPSPTKQQKLSLDAGASI